LPLQTGSSRENALWIGRNGRSRVLVKDIRQLSFLEISRHGKLAIGNRVEAYTCHSAGNYYRVSQAAGGMLACRVLLPNDHAPPDWPAGEIAHVRHFRISRIPKPGFNRVKLRQ